MARLIYVGLDFLSRAKSIFLKLKWERERDTIAPVAVAVVIVITIASAAVVAIVVIVVISAEGIRQDSQILTDSVPVILNIVTQATSA